MASTAAARASAAGGRHLVLYDGVCGLCNRLVQFILAHDHDAVFRFAPLQSAIGHGWVARSGGNPGELTTVYVIPEYETAPPQLLARSAAVLFVVGEVPGPWRLLRVLGLLPKTLLDFAYQQVAKSRYRIFGRVEVCLLPSAEHRQRFLA